MSSRSVSVFASGFKFPEGPAFDRNGKFLSEVKRGNPFF
jgi:hypothetical protein